MQAGSNNAPAGQVLWEETVPGGAHWSGVMRRGTPLRFTDIEGGANLSTLFRNFEEKTERYNMPDTLKAQHTAFLTRGHCGFADMGRVLFSIVEDTAGWHDTVCGVIDDATMSERFGTKRFQEYRNAMHRSGRDGLLKEMGRWGLGKRDLHGNVNFFSKVTADADGKLSLEAGKAAGAYVDVRFDMDVLLAISAAPHPFAEKGIYAPKPVKLTAWRAGIPPAADACPNFPAQDRRAFVNNARYFAD